MKVIDLTSAIIGFIFVNVPPSTALARCTHPPIPWKFGGNITSTWRATDDSVCTSTSKAPQNIAKIEIASKPQHGVAGKNGPFGSHTSRPPGYKGSDSFVYTVTSNSNYRKGAGWVAKITVLVIVE
jgi:hypothetical protein